MTTNIEYTFYNGAYSTEVNHEKQSITTYERGGWSRSYTLTFEELLKYAKQWEVIINLEESDEIIATIATNIILANNAVSHNLDPFCYIKKTKNITDPRDMEILQNFENLFKKYDAKSIIKAMSEDKIEVLKSIIYDL